MAGDVNKRSNEAYVLIDHRNSPGVSPEFIAQNNLQNVAPVVGPGQVFESAMVVCHGCGADIILNPNRSREREWCMVHDAYLCDACGLRRKQTGECKTLKQQFADAYDALQKGKKLILP